MPAVTEKKWNETFDDAPTLQPFVTYQRLPKSGAALVMHAGRCEAVLHAGEYYAIELWPELTEAMGRISTMPDHRHVLIEAQEFLAAPSAPPAVSPTDTKQNEEK